MKLYELSAFLEELAPLSIQEDYDNAGLLIGRPDSDIKSVLISLDCTEAVIDEAIRLKSSLIISHHPILFRGIKKITGRTYVERVIEKAIQHGIALYAIHTNYDNVWNGVNKKIAEKLGLTDLQILRTADNILEKLITFCPINEAASVREALFKAGAGNIGNYSECSFNGEGFGTFKANEQANPYVGEKNIQHQEAELRIEVIFQKHIRNKLLEALIKAHPYEEPAFDLIPLHNIFARAGAGMYGYLKEEISTLDFLQKVKSTFHCGSIKHTPILKEKVKKIAVCGGSGSFLLNDAIKNSCDVFISSDFTYHKFFDAEDHIVIADIGHYESEQFTIELLAAEIQNNFPNFAVHLTKVNTNPISYL